MASIGNHGDGSLRFETCSCHVRHLFYVFPHWLLMSKGKILDSTRSCYINSHQGTYIRKRLNPLFMLYIYEYKRKESVAENEAIYDWILIGILCC